jgi:hypothetical protein
MVNIVEVEKGVYSQRGTQGIHWVGGVVVVAAEVVAAPAPPSNRPR